jgi:hypothetical protein
VQTAALEPLMKQDNLNTATFRKAALADRSLLVNHLFTNPAAIAPGFTFSSPREIPDEEFLLGTNKEKRLYVVELARRFEEGLLYRSLAHLKWAMNNAAAWGKQDKSLSPDQRLMPGIIYIVPDSPPAFIEAFEFINDTIPLAVIRYWYLESDREHGFYFEPLLVQEKESRGKAPAQREIQIASLREQAGLTREEIMKFLS